MFNNIVNLKKISSSNCPDNFNILMNYAMLEIPSSVVIKKLYYSHKNIYSKVEEVERQKQNYKAQTNRR